MIMPLPSAMRQQCKKCGWKNPQIRPKGASCVQHPNFHNQCPQCGNKLEYCDLSIFEKMQYTLGVFK